MKRIVLFISCFLVFCFMFNEVLYCQDVYFLNKPETLYEDYSPDYGIVAELKSGDIIKIIGNIAAIGTGDNVSRVEVQTEKNVRGWLAVDSITVKDSLKLPDKITRDYLIHSYYLNVLSNGKKEKLFEYEPFWKNSFNNYEKSEGIWFFV